MTVILHPDAGGSVGGDSGIQGDFGSIFNGNPLPPLDGFFDYAPGTGGNDYGITEGITVTSNGPAKDFGDYGAFNFSPGHDQTPGVSGLGDADLVGGVLPSQTGPPSDIHSSAFHQWLTEHLGKVGDKVGIKLDSLVDTVSDPHKALIEAIRFVTGVNLDKGTFDPATLIGTIGAVATGGVASIIGGIDSLARFIGVDMPTIDVSKLTGTAATNGGTGTPATTGGAAAGDQTGTGAPVVIPGEDGPSIVVPGGAPTNGKTSYDSTPVLDRNGGIEEIVVTAHGNSGDFTYHVSPGDLLNAGYDPHGALGNIPWENLINHPDETGGDATKPADTKPATEDHPDRTDADGRKWIWDGEKYIEETTTTTTGNDTKPPPVVDTHVAPPGDITIEPPPKIVTVDTDVRKIPVDPPPIPVDPPKPPGGGEGPGPGPVTPVTPKPPPADTAFQFYAMPEFKLLPNDFGQPTLTLPHPGATPL